MPEQTSGPPLTPVRKRVVSAKTTTRLLLTLILLIVLGPVIGKEYRREISRWHHAAARQLWLEEKPQQALGKAAMALRWNSSDHDVLTDRAQWFTELGRYEDSLADWNQAIELQPDRIALYLQRCTTYLHLQRGDQVVADWKLIMRLHEAEGSLESQATDQLFNLYNNRAYHFSVAAVQLDDALDDANRAVDLLGGNIAMLDRHGFSQYLQAYELHLEGQHQAALARMKLAIKWADKTWARWQTQQPDRTWRPGAVKLHQQRSMELKRYRATLFFLRSQLHKKLNRPKLHQQDLDQIKNLGFHEKPLTLLFAETTNPRQQVVKLRRLLANQRESPDARSMILDTRGFILWRQKQARAALWDLELAVDFADSQTRMLKALLKRQKTIAVDLRPFQQDLMLLNKNLAVILYHRSLAYEALDQPARSERDQQRIQELGYELSPHLF